MTSTGFTIDSWQQLAVLATIVATASGLLGSMVRSRLDARKANDDASDRIIRLVETEADKRVEIVRTEFKLQIAEMQLEHRDEITKLKTDFNKQLSTLKREHDTYRCELAPKCSWRNKTTPPPTAA